MKADVIVKKNRLEIHSHLFRSFRFGIKKDVHRGLTSSQKFIPSKYFYDSRGSGLFEKICALPEYYPTRTEMSILKRAAPDIMRSFSSGDLVELGSGAHWKIRMFLDAAFDSGFLDMRYVPVDVSESAMKRASEALLRIYPQLEVFGIVADFTIHMDTIPADRPRMIFILGSTIGNFNTKECMAFLGNVAGSMNPDDRLIIGFDLLKPREAIEAAYNDTRGVTSEFNKNILHVVNRELSANFDPSHFRHLAFFNEEKERVEMHLEARKDITIRIKALDLKVELAKAETIHTEVCRKFSRKKVMQMADEAGLIIRKWFSDSREWFAVAELALRD
jgi:L-histidine N-alpha-methyltransferase